MTDYDRKTIERLRKENERLKKEVDELSKENDHLRKQLRQFDGPHTPLSKRRFRQPLELRAPRKRGAPVGHPGITRPVPTPTKVVDVTLDQCPNCKARLGAPSTVREKIIEEIPEPLPIEVIQFNLHDYDCPQCGRHFETKHDACPQKGRFGVTFLSLIVFLRVFMRGVIRKLPTFLDVQNGTTISAATVHNIFSRVAAACTGEYDLLKEKIRKADTLFIDETSISVLGKNWWIWIFRSSDSILFVIRHSRGSCVLEEVLGKEWTGVINSDGWRAYGTLPNAILQRCWAHLLRETKALTTDASGRHFHLKVTVIFSELKTFIADQRNVVERQKEESKLEREMKTIACYYRRYPELAPTCQLIMNGLPDWFTCVRYEGIEPTNNAAERGLRELVVLRNIMGALRSEQVNRYETLCSLFSTWQLRHDDPMKKMRGLLVRNLCRS